jgi:hypothetical protein
VDKAGQYFLGTRTSGKPVVMPIAPGQLLPALQADVNALIEALHTAAPGLGFVLGGAAAWAVSPRTTYWAAALAVAALLLVAGRGLLSSPSGGQTPVPTPAAAA